MKLPKKTSQLIALTIVLSSGIMLILFAYSDHIIHKRNSFKRLFPSHPILFAHQLDLKLNSFYFAGHGKQSVYLSNLTAPLYLVQADLPNLDTTVIRLRTNLPKTNLLRSQTKLAILPPNFYVLDGVTPRILQGTLDTGIASSVLEQPTYFSTATPVDKQEIAIRAVSTKTHEYELGKITLNPYKTTLTSGIITAQKEGIFSKDGILHFNQQRKQLIYTYRYRNEYLIVDNELLKWKIGHTIDTNKIAKIGINTSNEKTLQKMNTPPLVTNKFSATYGDYLFVCSNLMAQNEKRDRFKNNDVIDVYHLEKQTYEFSFYIPNYIGNPVNDFTVTSMGLVALHHHYIVIYQMAPKLFPFITKTKKIEHTMAIVQEERATNLYKENKPLSLTKN
ncbi:hypothetical protein KO500_17010 [Cellulophaga baltica]|uniref:hypothetical protein n=1 Tax=Cellulophaga TaxID=104264 RepID=UPI001C066C6D|nr:MULTISPECIES: hypothetical protein [Cellulophaga]MBU2998142.1 hypothetical protein [Cellulophaga baltica]MDO6769547.1 hypothetical protein [Cellulophaga sp. 1_MG-2023]